MGTMDLSPIIAFFVIGFIQQILGGRSITQPIAFALVLVVAFSVHEFSHAWVAYQLGDPTAKNQGRLTLDPRKHLDVLGSIMVLAVGFGWAKPVPVNPYNLRNGPKAGMAIVAAAGPLSNLALAIIASLPVRLNLVEAYYTSRFFPNPQELFLTFIWLNVVLLFFNLLPIAPLDGFRVVAGLLPYPTSQSFLKLEPLGPLILLLLIFFGGAFFRTLITGPTDFVVRLLLG
jgi:Zn-dependent protease